MDFPSFSEGLSLRRHHAVVFALVGSGFPFLFGRAFIEAVHVTDAFATAEPDFPSFSEGLSLRPGLNFVRGVGGENFPSFSEGLSLRHLLVGAFTEAK